MFGALAGKLLVEGRRAILLNQCVPANCGLSCLEGEGGCWFRKYIENFPKRIYSQHLIMPIPATISNGSLLFGVFYSFLKGHIKVKIYISEASIKYTLDEKHLKNPEATSKIMATRIFLFCKREEEAWWIWKHWYLIMIALAFWLLRLPVWGP